MNSIVITNLSKTYKDLKAVDNVSLTVKKGSIFGLLGPNGAGKSTVIECAIGLKPMDEGDINILNMNPQTNANGFFEKVGVQLQETVYQDKIKVRELCELFNSFYKNPIDYKELFEKFDIKKRENSYVTSLSGGERQKVAIILALIGDPEVIFLDELTTGLDPKARRTMWEYIKTLKDEGRTIFMTTHYMEEAEYLCDNIAIISQGSIVSMGTVEDVIKSSKIGIEITFRTEVQVEDLLRSKIQGINEIYMDKSYIRLNVNNDELLNQIIELLVTNNIQFTDLNINRPNLEDAYLKLIGKSKEEVEI